MKNEQKNIVQAFSGIVLLLAFLVANTHLPFFHHHNHHDHQHVDESVSHSHNVHADDACHNFVFHGAELQNCPHPGHAHEAETDCISCLAFIPVKFIIQKTEVGIDKIIPSLPRISETSSAVLRTKSLAYFLRGPPQNV